MVMYKHKAYAGSEVSCRVTGPNLILKLITKPAQKKRIGSGKPGWVNACDLLVTGSRDFCHFDGPCFRHRANHLSVI